MHTLFIIHIDLSSRHPLIGRTIYFFHNVNTRFENNLSLQLHRTVTYSYLVSEDISDNGDYLEVRNHKMQLSPTCRPLVLAKWASKTIEEAVCQVSLLSVH